MNGHLGVYVAHVLVRLGIYRALGGVGTSVVLWLALLAGLWLAFGRGRSRRGGRRR